MTRRRWLQVGIVGLAAAQVFFWLFFATVAWGLLDLFSDPSSAEAVGSKHFALALYGVLSLNVIAVVAFLLRTRRWAWMALGAVQVGNVLFASFATVTKGSVAWSVLAAAPAVVTLVLMCQLVRTQAAGPAATSEARSG